MLTARFRRAILSAMSNHPLEAEQTAAAARARSPVPTGAKIKRLFWSVVQATLYRYSFHTWSNWRAVLLRLFGAKIGHRCTIRRTSKVYYPWLLEMGDLSSLGDETEVYNLGRVRIGHRTTISQQAYLCAGTHDYTQINMPLVTMPIIVGDDAWICARAFVGPGVNVGDGAILGACAVAVKDVPPWTIATGNPARVAKGRTRPESK